MQSFLALVADHPATHHPVFTELAKRPLAPQRLAAFLAEMGAFCQLSREAGTIAERLRLCQLPDEANLIEAIFQSEQGHDLSFAEMVVRLLPEEDVSTWLWCHSDSLAISAIRDLCRQRQNVATNALPLSLTGVLVVERHANSLIIPGEVAAFIDSGHYGSLTLADIPYLAAHAGDDGAEHAHERAIIKVMTTVSMVRPDWQGEIEEGVTTWLKVMNRVYDQLMVIIQEEGRPAPK